jgi:hypothetical protein
MGFKDTVIAVLGLLLAMVVSPFILLTCYLACKINENGETCRECRGWR